MNETLLGFALGCFFSAGVVIFIVTRKKSFKDYRFKKGSKRARMLGRLGGLSRRKK